MSTTARAFVYAAHLILVASALAQSAGQATAPIANQTTIEAAGKLWWSHIQYLAGDELQGRQTGSDGYNKGAA